MLVRLRQNPRVEHAVQDVLVGGSVVPGDNGGAPADWDVETHPRRQLGLELIRAPQL